MSIARRLVLKCIRMNVSLHINPRNGRLDLRALGEFVKPEDSAG